MTPFRRSWVTSDPDDEDNAQYVPDNVPSDTPAPKDPQSKLDDFADRLTDTIEPQPGESVRPSQRLIDIDRLIAQRQGLPEGQGTLDPYADPAAVQNAQNDRLRPFRDRYAKLHDIASMWGLSMNGYRLPRDLPDEDIDAYLDRMNDDLQKRISRKRRYGY